MDPADYIADLEEEVRTLRGKVAGLEKKVCQLEDDLKISRDRKVEEVCTFAFLLRRYYNQHTDWLGHLLGGRGGPARRDHPSDPEPG